MKLLAGDGRDEMGDVMCARRAAETRAAIVRPGISRGAERSIHAEMATSPEQFGSHRDTKRGGWISVSTITYFIMLSAHSFHLLCSPLRSSLLSSAARHNMQIRERSAARPLAADLSMSIAARNRRAQRNNGRPEMGMERKKNTQLRIRMKCFFLVFVRLLALNTSLFALTIVLTTKCASPAPSKQKS